MLKPVLTLLTLFAACSVAHAQFGVRASYVRAAGSPFAEYLETFPAAEFQSTHLALGLNYWFRLKNHRVEFRPEALVRMPVARPESAHLAKISAYGLQMATSIYPFDLLGDCNCPTFSKQSGVFERGFFVELVAGAEYQDASLVEMPGEKTLASGNGIVPRLGIGAGFDLGISDLLTITPYARYIWIPGSELPGDLITEEEQRMDTLALFSAGLRLTFRPDYVRGRRY